MTTITPPVLMPCPFCGQLPAINSLGHVHHIADGCVLHDGAFTADQWNRRSPTPSPALPSAENIPDAAIYAAMDAMQNAVISDDEGEFPRLFDLLDFSGENKARAVTHGLAHAAVYAAAPHIIAAMQATPETGWQGMREALCDAREALQRIVDNDVPHLELIYARQTIAKIDAALSASDLGKAKPHD
jgi:hypothetical protein